MSKLAKGIYRHYKGEEYEVLDQAFTSNDKKEVVIYRSLKEEKVWTRSKKEFLSQVEVKGEKKARFEFVREGENLEMEQRYLRALADYQNLLKQNAQERLELVKYAVEDFLNEILPVYDHLKLSLKHLKPEEEDNAWVKGVRCVLKEFKSVLEAQGLEEIKTEGEKFNHEEMEALEGEGEKVNQEVMPGYKLKGKVIRVAKVTVKK